MKTAIAYVPPVHYDTPELANYLAAASYEERSVEMPKPELDLSVLTWHPESVGEETPFAFHRSWWTLCGRYRVVRITYKAQYQQTGEEYADTFAAEARLYPGNGKVIPKRIEFLYVFPRLLGKFDTLEKAIIACEKHGDKISLNSADVLLNARAMNLLELKNGPKKQSAIPKPVDNVGKKKPRGRISRTQSQPTPKKGSRKMATKTAGLEIDRAQAILLAEELGVHTASTYDNAKLAKAIAKVVGKRDDEEEDLEDEDLQTLLDEVKEALADEEEISVEGEEDEPEDEDEEEADDEDEDEDDEDEKPKSKKPTKSKKSKDEDEEEEEDDDEDEKPKKKSKGKPEKSTKKKSKPSSNSQHSAKGEGVLATIFDLLAAASKKAPTTKAKILKVLVKKFDHIDEERLKKTLNDACGYWAKKKEIDVRNDGDGGWWSV